MTSDSRTDKLFIAGLVLRFLVVVTFVVLAVQLSEFVQGKIGMDIKPQNEALVNKMILFGLLAYILLTALPFVPGAEIGMTLLTVFGAQIAPLIYVATVISLLLAFAVGRRVPPSTTARALRGLRLHKAARVLDELAATAPNDRMKTVLGMAADTRLRPLANHRHLALLVLINVPGNVFIGGGGGLAFASGLSGLFRPVPFLLTVMIAVLPVPFAVFLFG